MTVVVMCALLVLLLPRLVDLVARPVVRGIGLRNAVRRPGEALLVMLGSALATALITASLLVGASFGDSVRGQAQTLLGPIDEIVTIAEGQSIPASALAPGEPFDDLLVARTGNAALTSPRAPGALRSDVRILAAALDDLRRLDEQSSSAAGLPATLSPSGALINELVASSLGVQVGDTVDVYSDGVSLATTVEGILPRSGVSGFADIIVGPLAFPVDSLDNVVLVSNVGDWEAGASLTNDATTQLQQRFGDTAFIDPVKSDLLADAKSDSQDMTELFSTVGGFSVIAAILLIVNLFLMLVADRQREIGTLQGLGISRPVLRRSLALEASMYALLASTVGAVAGMGLAWLTIRSARSTLPQEADFALTLNPDASVLFQGGGLGLIVALITMTVVSFRVSRLNIAASLKNLESYDRSPGTHRRMLILSGIVVAAAVAVTLGLPNNPYVAIVAPVVALMACVPLVAPILGQRRGGAILTIGSAVYCATVFGTRSGVFVRPDLAVFLVQGVTLVFLSCAALVFGESILRRAVQALYRRFAIPAIGLRFPLARHVRSNLIVGMFGLVVFTIVFMAVMNAIFIQQVPRFTAEVGGGFDLIVDADEGLPASTAELLNHSRIDVAVPILQGTLNYEYKTEGADPSTDFWWSSVVPAAFPVDLGPTLRSRAPDFATDADVWRALAAGDDWLIAPLDSQLKVGDEVTLTSAGVEEATGTKTMKVAGVSEWDWAIDSGFFVPNNVASFLEQPEPSVLRHYVRLVDRGDIAGDVELLRRDFVNNGLRVTSAVSIAEADIDEQRAFLALLQRYLVVGLIVGITGLCAVLLRSVKDRSNELATMIALGIPLRKLRQMFVVEALFLALQGAAIGVGMGILSSWSVFTKSTVFGPVLPFVIPTATVAVVVAIVAVASAVIAYFPAMQASRLHPATALRAAG